jgi:hypothetical protein
VVGGIYSPNHQRSRWWRLLSHGASDSPVRHQTLSDAPATSPGRWVLTVGASDSWATGQSLFTVRCAFWLCSDFYAHCSALTARCKRPLALCSRYSAGTPDSPVNYSGAAPRIPEGGKFRVGFPGAPDIVRWHTRQSGAPDQGCLRFNFAPCFEPFLLTLYWFVLNLWHL